MNVIEVHDLQKKYEDVEAVRGIAFEVRAREVFALLGPKGMVRVMQRFTRRG